MHIARTNFSWRRIHGCGLAESEGRPWWESVARELCVSISSGIRFFRSEAATQLQKRNICACGEFFSITFRTKSHSF
jgi:hypothetical protein